MSILKYLDPDTRFYFSGNGAHDWKVRENKKAPRPAYDLLVKPRGGKRGRVVFTVLLDLCKENES